MDGSDSGDELSVPPSAGDSLDHLLARAVAAPAAQPLLAPTTVLAERYEILRVLGVGGMGAVYLAHDRVLERAVALKLHRTTAITTRLHREAIAMARLAHPNVVTVFEVGSVEDRTFVAMEYVEGDTLRGWLASAKWPRAEILAALLAAGEGLVCAHAAGLVHRDIKPDNILVGRDGRVRVGDFGLAQLAAPSTGMLRIPIDNATATGTIVGTPAYMAPEQIEGGELDARTDQFGFCVVAWEALYGQRPYQGATTVELLAAIKRGIPEPQGARVPSRLRGVMMRGLAADPANRWPSIAALLAALRVARRRPRLITGASIGVLVAIVTAYALWPARDLVAACDAITSELDLQFSPDAQAVLLAGLRVASRNGPTTTKVIESELVKARERARTTQIAACRARVTHQWSAELATASNDCLRAHARTVSELYRASRDLDVADVMSLTVQLPDVEHCADGRVLAGWRPLSVDPLQTDAVIEVRAKLAAATVQLEAGKLVEARTAMAALKTLPVMANPAVRGRADLLAAQLAIVEGDYQGAEKQMSDVYFAARGADDSELSLQTLSELIAFASKVRRDDDLTQRWVRDGIAEAEREKLRQPRAAAMVLISAANAAAANDQSNRAIELAAQAEAILARSRAPLMTSATEHLRMESLSALGKVEEALAISNANIAQLRATLGDTHPKVAEEWSDQASLLLDANRTVDAGKAAAHAADILGTGVSSTSLAYATAELNLGASLVMEDNGRAKMFLDRARARWVRAYGEDHPDVALADTNLAIIYVDAGEVPRALAALRHSIAVQTKVLGPEHLELAAAYYNLAVAERQGKVLDEAQADAGRALAIFAKRATGTSRHVSTMILNAQIANLRGDHAAARTFLQPALAIAADARDPTTHAWAELEAGIAELGLGQIAKARSLLAASRAIYLTAGIEKRVKDVDAVAARLP